MSDTADVRRTIEDLPCARCTDPRSADVRRWLDGNDGQVNEQQVSPSGLPLICCRIVTLRRE
jgi:hypothetical protein